MRHLPTLLGAAALGLSLFTISGQAKAAPPLPLNIPKSTALPVEKAGYYGRSWYGGCYRPYGYRSYGYRSYGYGYGHGHRSYRRHGSRH